MESILRALGYEFHMLPELYDRNRGHSIFDSIETELRKHQIHTDATRLRTFVRELHGHVYVRAIASSRGSSRRADAGRPRS